MTNVFESVDVITLIKGANYDELNLNVGEALQKRSEVCMPLHFHYACLASFALGFPWNLHMFH